MSAVWMSCGCFLENSRNLRLWNRYACTVLPENPRIFSSVSRVSSIFPSFAPAHARKTGHRSIFFDEPLYKTSSNHHYVNFSRCLALKSVGLTLLLAEWI